VAGIAQDKAVGATVLTTAPHCVQQWPLLGFIASLAAGRFLDLGLPEASRMAATFTMLLLGLLLILGGRCRAPKPGMANAPLRLLVARAAAAAAASSAAAAASAAA